MFRRRSVLRKSGFADAPNAAETLAFSRNSLGYPCPQHCPYREEAGTSGGEALGVPLSIRDVAALIGCSPWTVRQTLIPLGLPVFRSGAGGKQFFYKNQVVRWIERHQGGRT